MEELILSIRIGRRWPVLALLGVAGVWLVAAVLRAPPEIVAVVLAAAPPVALGLLAAALLPGAGRSVVLAEAETRLAGARELVTGLQSQLEHVDFRLATSVERTQELAKTLPDLGSGAAALESAAARVAGSGEATQRIVDGFAAALPSLAQTIGVVDATLRSVSADSAVQLRAVETMLGSVQERGRSAAAEADASIAAMTALLGKIDEASIRNTAALSKRAYALDAAVDGVLERTTAAVDHMREAVEVRLAALEGGVDQAGRQLTIMGDDGLRRFNQRLELLQATAASLKGIFDEHEAGSARLYETVSSHVEGTSARIAAFGTYSGAAVDALAARLAGLEERLTALAGPLEAHGAVVEGLEAQAEAFGSKVADIDAVLGERLAGTRQSMAGLESEAERLFGAVADLGASVAAGSALIGDAAATLAQERAAVTQIAAEMAGHFDAARAALAQIEADAAAAAAGIETGLAADVARVAEAGEAAAAAVRSALAAVIDAAVERLGKAGSTHAEAAFGAPVRAQLGEIETAAARAAASGQSAAERLAGQMLRLVETVDTVEARIGEVETRFDVRARDSLAAGSARLINRLNAGAVDVAGLLSVSVDAADWAAYLRGDRTVFAKAIAGRIDRDTARQMARLFQHDHDFQVEAVRYCEVFEALVARLIGDRDGDALATMMLSSDLGKVYVAIADAADRLPPTR